MKNGVRWRLSEIQSGLDYLNKMALMYKTGLIICCFLIATEVGSRSIFDNDGKWIFFNLVFGTTIFGMYPGLRNRRCAIMQIGMDQMVSCLL